MHLIDHEDLTPDRISRLIIREELEGERFAVRFEKSDIVLNSEGEQPVQIKCELEDEDILDFFEQEGAAVLKRYGVDAIELDCVRIKDNPNYLFPAPVIAMETARAEKEGQMYHLDPDTLPTLSAFFGCITTPQFNPPMALLMALQKGQKGVCNQLLKRIRKFPSIYGVADYTPKYYAYLGRITSPEERSMRWLI